MQRIRLASVSYINALPLNWGLTRGRHREAFETALVPPHECARRLREGFADVALLPSIEFARISGLVGVPGTGIASRHEVRSVLLISRVPIPSIERLAVDLNSRTSVGLARLVLARRYGCRPRLEPMAPDLGAMLQRHDAALIIGDAALKAVPGPGDHLLDLAREWHEMTRLPFVFALWACRPVVNAMELRRILEQSLLEGLENLGRIAEEESARTGTPIETITTYLRRNIHYRLGPDETDSLRVFFRMCHEEGILPVPEPSCELGVQPATWESWPEGPREARRSGRADGTGIP